MGHAHFGEAVHHGQADDEENDVAAPDSADALNLKGIALKQLHRPADALAAYDQALQRRPDLAEALIKEEIRRLTTG